MAEQKAKDPPEFEAITAWFTKDWAHVALVIFAVLFIITLVMVVRRPTVA